MNKPQVGLAVLTAASFVISFVMSLVAGHQRTALAAAYEPNPSDVSAVADLADMSNIFLTWAGVGVLALLVVAAIRYELARLRVRIDA